MKFKERVLSRTLEKAVKTFPAIVLTGPRQSGKTTLFKQLFAGTHKYVSLENPDVRIRARQDPNAFINQNGPPVILDEIQYCPELLSYIKTQVDEDRRPNQWLLTGSQNFALMDSVAQSLAGRAAVLTLLPFSISERFDQAGDCEDLEQWLLGLVSVEKSRRKMSLSELVLRGFYPEIACRRAVDRQLWCGSYITTYLERDIRNLGTVGDLSQFERFLVSCATRTGQILNLSDIARDIGISVPTAKRWLSLLEAGYQVFLLYPYYRNIGKRLVKSPKLYFNDPALCSYLLGIHSEDVLLNSPSLGNLFETVVVGDFLKRFLNFGQRPSMYYLRSRDGLEIDLVFDLGGRLHLFEIKSSETVTDRHATSLKRLAQDLGSEVQTAGVLSCTRDNYAVTANVMNFGWKNVLGR